MAKRKCAKNGLVSVTALLESLFYIFRAMKSLPFCLQWGVCILRTLLPVLLGSFCSSKPRSFHILGGCHSVLPTKAKARQRRLDTFPFGK